MKRIPIIASIFLLLTACSGSSTVACDQTVNVGDVSICLVSGWEQVPDERLRSDKNVPEETVAVFQRTAVAGGQSENIVITRERVAASVPSLTYAQANAKIVANTPEYAEIEQRNISLGKEKSLLHIFTARPVPDYPARRFYQVSLTKGTTGYIATGTLPFSVDETTENELITMLTSFAIGS